MTQPISVVLSRNRTAAEESELESQLLDELGRRPGIEIIQVPHLYDLPPDGAAAELLRSIEGHIVVAAWLYPRSAYWVLRANHVRGHFLDGSDRSEEDDPAETSADSTNDEPNDEPQRIICCLDLRAHDEPRPFLDTIDRIRSLSGGDLRAADSHPPLEAVDQTADQRWYPVIDFDRCTHCLECLNFCLFGVFGVGESNQIVIEEPDACRAGCPACSRICPQGAIMFPRHSDPAIAGDANASLESLKLDLSQLFAGISPAEMAAAERDRALAEHHTNQSGGPSGPDVATAHKDDLDQLVDDLDDLEL